MGSKFRKITESGYQPKSPTSSIQKYSRGCERLAEKKLEKAVRDYSKGFAGRIDEELALAMAITITPKLAQSEKDETKMDTVTCAKGVEGKSMSEEADLLLMSRTIDF